jgi:hypothetical protein
MKYKIIEHCNKENGHLKGYSIAYKPCPFIPYWKYTNQIYSSKTLAKNDICFMMLVNCELDYEEEYE